MSATEVQASEARLSDESLVRTAAGGDLTAFDTLVLRYQDRIFNLAYRLTGSPDEAEDVTQDVFLRAHRALGSFRRESSFYTWLYRIAVNACHSQTRKTVRRRQVEGVRLEPSPSTEETGNPSRHEPAATGEMPDEAAQRVETQKRVQQAIAELAEDHRQVILLRDFEGLNYGQIAEVLGVTRAAVKSRLHRARLDLAGRLRDLIE